MRCIRLIFDVLVVLCASFQLTGKSNPTKRGTLAVLFFRLPFSSSSAVAGGTLGFANLYAKRLYDDLLSNYNRLIRPVNNSTDKLTVWLNLKLSQLIEVVIKTRQGGQCFIFTKKILCIRRASGIR